MEATIETPIHEFPEPDGPRYRITVLRAGTFRLDGGGMFGLIPKSMWSAWTPADAENRIGLATNCLLLEDGTRRVLVETGYGDKWSPKERAIYALAERTVVDALREVGVEPEAIDDVVVTHLHFDHAAGLTRLDATGQPVPTFPRARIHVQRREWDDALANRSTMTRTYLASHLGPIRERVALHDGVAQVLPGLAVAPLVGHTWGQQGVFVRDESGTLTVFPADLLPTVHHAHLAASMAYDMLPYDNMLTKRAFLAKAADHGWTLVLDHEPNTPKVRVTRDQRDPSRCLLQPLA
jgi:glyoxylase-like metal-dependent hydrolase (beta-lactamase superfamily II)